MEAALLDATGTAKHGGSEEGAVACEVKKQLYLAGPLVVGFLLQNMVQMVSVMFVGHLGELALASASLATSFAGVTGFSLLVGVVNITSHLPPSLSARFSDFSLVSVHACIGRLAWRAAP